MNLSDAGQALLADETHAREAWMNEQLAGLGGEELATLRGAVEIITEMVNKTE